MNLCYLKCYLIKEKVLPLQSEKICEITDYSVIKHIVMV